MHGKHADKMNKKQIKLCRMSLPFASLVECGVKSDIPVYNKPFEIACEEIVFKFVNDFKSSMKINVDVVFKLLVPQITGSSRRPFLRFLI